MNNLNTVDTLVLAKYIVANDIFSCLAEEEKLNRATELNSNFNILPIIENNIIVGAYFFDKDDLHICAIKGKGLKKLYELMRQKDRIIAKICVFNTRTNNLVNRLGFKFIGQKDLVLVWEYHK